MVDSFLEPLAHHLGMMFRIALGICGHVGSSGLRTAMQWGIIRANVEKRIDLGTTCRFSGSRYWSPIVVADM
jgi:hypothetical protein